MKLTVDRGPLLEALGRTQGAAGNGKMIPILSHVLLEADGERLRLSCADMVVDVTCEIAATVDAPGRVAVPVGLLHDVARNLPDGAEMGLKMSPEDNRLAVACARSRFQLPTLPAGDFPMKPGPTVQAVKGTMPAADLLRLFEKTAFAAAGEHESRFWLQGVYLHRRGSGDSQVLRAAATDGQMLTYAETPCPEGLGELADVIVPNRMAAEVRRLLAGVGGDAELALDGDRITVAIPSARLGSQRLEGNYPAYERVIPSDPAHVVGLKTGALRAAVRRAMLVAMPSGEGSVRAVVIRLAERQAGVAAWSLERGAADDVVEADYAGPEMELRFNGKQLGALVDQIDGEACEIALTGPGDPVIVRDPADMSRLSVNVPLRV